MTGRGVTLRNPWLGAAICAVAGAALFQFCGNAVRGYIDTASVFWWWGVQWFTPGAEAEHGPILLLLAGWLLWRNLRLDWPATAATGSDPGAPPASVWPGFVAMALALALHALGFAVQQTRVSIVALLLFTWGVLRWGGGPRWGRAAVFPLGLLVLAIPVELLDAAGFHLRLAVIATTEILARAVGVDVVRSGTQLFAPDHRYLYDVAAACSGVRSLLALLALSSVMGYLQLRTWWARGIVLVLVFPLTYLGNVARIGGIVLAGEWFGQQAGEAVHAGAGWLVFLVVLGGVQLVITGLMRWTSAGAATDAGVGATVAARAERPTKTAPLPAGVAVGGPVAIVGLCVAAVVFTRQVPAWAERAEAGVRVTEAGEPAALPAFLGTEWIGQATPVTAVEREVLPADTGYARRNYVSTRDRRHQVFLSIVLSGQDRTSIHRPELCVVGQGWTIADQRVADFESAAGESLLPVTLLRLSREVVAAEGQRQSVQSLLAYWFVGRERVTASTADRLWWTALNRLRLRPDRWAYVVAQSLVLPGEDEREVWARMEEVVRGAWPTVSAQPAPRVEAGAGIER